MKVLEKLRWLARPYEDEDIDENEEFEPAFKSEKRRERADRSDRVTTREEPAAVTFNTDSERRNNKVVNIHTTTQLQVVLMKPDRFEQGRDIADHLRDKHTVVLNLESVSKDIARRLLDFVSGVAYASGGRVEKVAIGTYIATPFNVDIVGDLVADLENSGCYNF